MLEEALAAEQAASVEAATAAANEIAKLTTDLGVQQGIVNGLHSQISDLEKANMVLEGEFNKAAVRRDELKIELTTSFQDC